MRQINFRVELGHGIENHWKSIQEDFQTELITAALWQTGGSKEHASMLLGMKRTTLVERMKSLGITWENNDVILEFRNE